MRISNDVGTCYKFDSPYEGKRDADLRHGLGAGVCGLHFRRKDKKQAAPPPKKDANPLDVLDYSKIVWPNPPSIARIKFTSQFFGEKREEPKRPRR